MQRVLSGAGRIICSRFVAQVQCGGHRTKIWGRRCRVCSRAIWERHVEECEGAAAAFCGAREERRGGMEMNDPEVN